MKSFKDFPQAKGFPANYIQFVELMFDPKSELNKEQNFEERVKQAIRLTAVEENIMTQDKMKELIHIYLSFFQHSNKYQFLMLVQYTIWKVSKKVMEEEDIDIKKMEFLDDMVTRADKLYGEIYGSVAAIGAEQIRKGKTPEMRLKSK